MQSNLVWNLFLEHWWRKHFTWKKPITIINKGLQTIETFDLEVSFAIFAKYLGRTDSQVLTPQHSNCHMHTEQQLSLHCIQATTFIPSRIHTASSFCCSAALTLQVTPLHSHNHIHTISHQAALMLQHWHSIHVSCLSVSIFCLTGPSVSCLF